MTLSLYFMINPLIYALEILKYAASGALVFLFAWYFIKPYLSFSYKKQASDVKIPEQEGLLTLRLQAYERLTLFIERINPENMLIRIHVPGATVAELQQLVLSEIRAEYQHNITQQIYISSACWQLTKKLKDDTIFLINSAIKDLSNETPSVEMSRAILSHLASLELNPYDIALDIIKKEVRDLYNF